jgi:hypothetical protein
MQRFALLQLLLLLLLWLLLLQQLHALQKCTFAKLRLIA